MASVSVYHHYHYYIALHERTITTGHYLRKDGIEKLALTGKIAGKRARGRQGHSSPKDCRMEWQVRDFRASLRKSNFELISQSKAKKRHVG